MTKPNEEQMRRDHEAMQWLERRFGARRSHIATPSKDCEHYRWSVNVWDADNKSARGEGPTLTDAILNAKEKWEDDHGQG